MAQNKFDEGIKKALEDRQIQPTESAWSRLESQLEGDSKRVYNRVRIRYAVAASIVLVLATTIVILTSGINETTPEPVIVGTDETIEDINEENNLTIEVEDNYAVAKVDQEEDKEAVERDEVKEKQLLLTRNANLENPSVQAAVASRQDIPDATVNAASEAVSRDVTNNNTAVAKADKVIQNTVQSLDGEVDALLREAQERISVKMTEPVYAVSAQSLLQEIEDDLDTSFRDRMLNMLINGYENVRTALVHRND